jgi:hypothetical protein
VRDGDVSGGYEYPLNDVLGIFICVEFRTRRRDVVDYSVVLLLKLEGKTETIRLYDGAHGRNEMHRYTQEVGKGPGEVVHSGDLGTGMRAAIEEIKDAHEAMIEGWRKT